MPRLCPISWARVSCVRRPLESRASQSSGMVKHGKAREEFVVAPGRCM